MFAQTLLCPCFDWGLELFKFSFALGCQRSFKLIVVIVDGVSNNLIYFNYRPLIKLT
jgi:hypothetical protein